MISADVEKLRAMNREAASRFVQSLLSDCEKAAGSPNFDRLNSQGIILVRAGHEQVDAVALNWLHQDLSARRLDIASALLNGLWHVAYRHSPLEVANVESLIAARRRIEPQGDAAYSSLQALSQALHAKASVALRNVVSLALQEILQEKHEPPVLDKLIHSLAEDALRRGST